MTKHFIKKVEDFVCENCGTEVIGNGYTNHCPNCLYSKHVDLETPGDRLSDCLGSMKPIAAELRKGEYFITQKCIKCGHEKRNKFNLNDNFEALLKICTKK